MTIYAFIPSRDSNYSQTTLNLFGYLDNLNIIVKSVVGKDSIFTGFAETLRRIQPEDDDIIILCHDDIQVISNGDIFLQQLKKLEDPKIGFIGVAGTTKLGQDSVWWNHDLWKQGFHRGLIFHGTDITTAEITYYGKCGEVVVLDGVFLAARAGLLKTLFAEKINYEGKWDFYDIHYTSEAWKQGLHNLTVPIFLIHNSRGELAGSTSWEKNRMAFIRNNQLPLQCK